MISEYAAQDNLVGTDVMISGNGNFIIYGSAGGNYANAYEKDPTYNNVWNKKQKLECLSDGYEFGMNVAITSDGKYIAVGARYHDKTIDAKQMLNTGMVQVSTMARR